VVRFNRTIPPGGEGKITLKVNTRGYSGNINKGASIYTNDPRHQLVRIGIKAFVRISIHLSKSRIYFKGLAGQKITKTITIRAELDRPLNIETTRFNLDKKVTYKIEEIETGRIYRIHFTNIPGPAEIYHGSLKLKTNYPEKPDIKIRINGKFRKRKPITSKSRKSGLGIGGILRS